VNACALAGSNYLAAVVFGAVLMAGTIFVWRRLTQHLSREQVSPRLRVVREFGERTQGPRGAA
jgi:hypothetical protein